MPNYPIKQIHGCDRVSAEFERDFRSIAIGDDRAYARQRFGFRGIDAYDLGVSIRAAQSFSMQEFIRKPVGGKLSRAGNFCMGVNALYGVANDAKRGLQGSCVFGHTVMEIRGIDSLDSRAAG